MKTKGEYLKFFVSPHEKERVRAVVVENFIKNPGLNHASVMEIIRNMNSSELRNEILTYPLLKQKLSSHISQSLSNLKTYIKGKIFYDTNNNMDRPCASLETFAAFVFGEKLMPCIAMDEEALTSAALLRYVRDFHFKQWREKKGHRNELLANYCKDFYEKFASFVAEKKEELGQEYENFLLAIIEKDAEIYTD